MKYLTKSICVFLSCACIYSTYATEINMAGKNMYIENQSYYQVCFENTKPEEKISVNNVVDREVCVNLNNELKFTVVNIMPEKMGENLVFSIKIKEKVKSNLPGLTGVLVSNFYLGDEADRGNVMKLDYQDLDTDTVITSPDFGEASSKVSINNYMIDKYMNI